MNTKVFKTFIFNLCIITLFIFSGCKQNTGTESSNTTQTQTQTETNNITYLKVISKYEGYSFGT